jgi:hypothetical protein
MPVKASRATTFECPDRGAGAGVRAMTPMPDHDRAIEIAALRKRSA